MSRASGLCCAATPSMSMVPTTRTAAYHGVIARSLRYEADSRIAGRMITPALHRRNGDRLSTGVCGGPQASRVFERIVLGAVTTEIAAASVRAEILEPQEAVEIWRD